jgi:glyoxylase-like metal-dependent hydrolase (beta-lactamase superfamily II)
LLYGPFTACGPNCCAPINVEEEDPHGCAVRVQAPGIYRHKLGNFEVTVLSDGNLPFDADLFAGDKDRADELLNNAHFPRKSTTSVNTWLVNTGKQLVLVDTGGSSHLGPTLGKLPKHLADAGVTPDQIDVVIITHMHPDHVPGLLTADKKALFKNAVVHVGDQEHGFWSSEQIYNSVPQDVKGFLTSREYRLSPTRTPASCKCTRTARASCPV